MHARTDTDYVSRPLRSSRATVSNIMTCQVLTVVIVYLQGQNLILNMNDHGFVVSLFASSPRILFMFFASNIIPLLII